MEYEYRARCVRHGDGTDALERTANDMAKQGWRLVSTSAAANRAGDVYVWLFFEREREA